MTSIRHSRTPTVPDDILDATLACVLAVGVRRTTLTDVARRAGVSRMTLYRRVPDVTTLILALLTREFTALLAAAQAETAELATARERLTESTVLIALRLPRTPLVERILDVDAEMLQPYLTERLGQTQHLALAHARRLINEGLADGSIRDCDPDLVAYCLLTTLQGFAVSARVREGRVSDARVAAELRHLLDSWLSLPGGAVPARSRRRRAA